MGLFNGLGLLKKTTKNKKFFMTRLSMRLRFSAFTVVALTVLLAQPSYGLGLGDVKLQSYIGQRLAASIPLLSVSDSNSLLVEVTPLNNVVLQSQVQKVNNELVVGVSSEQLISEPYLQFSLKVEDSNQTIVREFTVLLEINPQTGSSSQSINASTPYNSQQLLSERIVDFSATSGDTLLGPYEWAQKDQIPSRFGAVLDGQSLWRVARRINSAMDVSLNQMMWALYLSNPDAFSNDSIESLRAGVFLDIPQFSVVSSVSDGQAKRNLESLSVLSQAADVPTSEVAVVGEDSVIAQSEQIEDPATLDESISNLVSEATEPDEDSFRLLGLDDTSLINADNPTETNLQTIETINVLSVTVGNLTQELIRKDKQIEFLEEKISALEGVAALDSIPSESGSSLLELPSTSLSQATESSTIATNELEIKPWYLWLGLFLITSLGLLFFRNKLKELNLFGDTDEIEFVKQKNINITTSSTLSDIKSRDFSEKSTSDKGDDNFAEDDLDDGYNSFADISINYIDEDSIVDIQDTTKYLEKDYIEFEKNLESLIKKDDYDEVIELLTSSRNKIIDDDRYYFERLRCYFLKKDEDGFYAFYDEIEYTIQHFPENWNRKISEMVIELGQKVQDSA